MGNREMLIKNYFLGKGRRKMVMSGRIRIGTGA
jgi:hypothetical protein